MPRAGRHGEHPPAEKLPRTKYIFGSFQKAPNASIHISSGITAELTGVSRLVGGLRLQAAWLPRSATGGATG